MKYLRSTIFTLFIAPTAFGGAILTYKPEMIIGKSTPDASITLSLIGTTLSYYGVLFSLYAAIEVRELSSKHLSKLRSPSIIKKLDSISNSLRLFANEPSRELRGQEFFTQIPVAIRSSRNIKSPSVRRVALETEKSLGYLLEQVKIPRPLHTKASDLGGYWDLLQKISELADESREHVRNIEASQ